MPNLLDALLAETEEDDKFQKSLAKNMTKREHMAFELFKIMIQEPGTPVLTCVNNAIRGADELIKALEASKENKE